MQVGDTTPVDDYPDGASPYGVADIAGNVWEWTSSLLRPYPYDANDGREEPAGDETHIMRGGAWNYGPEHVAAFSRGWSDPLRADLNSGFRLARST